MHVTNCDDGESIFLVLESMHALRPLSSLKDEEELTLFYVPGKYHKEESISRLA